MKKTTNKNKKKQIKPIKQKMNIAYTIDIQGQGALQFANQLINSLYSIKKHNNNNNISVNIFYGNIHENYISTINKLKSENFDIIFRKLSDNDMKFMQQFTKQQPTSQARPWCGIVYARLWLAKHLMEEDRCLYLDSDTLIRGDLSELYNTDMGDKSYGMVMGCIPEYGYNSGVILQNLKKIREDNKWEGLNEHLRKYARSYMLPDQTVINRFYKNDIFELPLKWNYPPFGDRQAIKNDECSKSVIWHFYNGGSKPYAFTQMDWCKVEWNKMLLEANNILSN
jgi:lipopolysaccharide biosynthesis glycosyltransferase